MSVIVPAWNAAATIGRTLEALAAQDTDTEFEVIVVDDGSTDDTVNIARRGPLETIVLEQGHRGPGPARDLGISRAGGELIAFIDADCFPTPGWLRAGVEALRGADLVQGAVHRDPTPQVRPFDRTIWVTGAGPLFETANLFARRSLIDRIGGFEDWLRAGIGKPLGEDVWFGWRARRAGARIEFCEQALVHHAVFRRGGAEFASERVRLVYFPAIVRKIPELRRELLVAGIFLNRRTAAFDAALAAAVLALGRRSPAPLLVAIPYAWLSARGTRRWGRRAPAVAGAELAADALGAIALLIGSARARYPVL